MKPKILYILCYFPQLSETYIKTEVEALQSHYEIKIITLNEADQSAESHPPYEVINDFEEILNVAKEFQPDFIHTHWISIQIEIVQKLAHLLDIPFTVRSHSFDVLWKKPKWYKALIGRKASGKVQRRLNILNDPHCNGVLCFPFARERLVRAGVKDEKLTDCYPIIKRAKFYDETENGLGILNLGAALPKKKMEDFIDLSLHCTYQTFNLYPIGYQTEKLIHYNAAKGNPVNIYNSVAHEHMPNIYKQHNWLVYTACEKMATVGWPLCLMEAQAAG